jgi:hypothetical protein
MQTSVQAFTEQWQEGQITRGEIDDWSLTNEDVTVMKVGQAVIKGTDPRRQGKKPVAAFTFDQFGGVIIGATGLSEKAQLDGSLDIVTGQGFTVNRKGYMAVKVTDTVAVDGDVFFTHTGGGASAVHTFRADNDTDKASKIPAVYKQAGVSGDIVEIKINEDMQIGVS